MYYMEYSQKLPISIQESWSFFSSPANLKIITPPNLGFQITNEKIDEMYPGQIISYTIRPFGNLKMEWVTEITHVREPFYFVDEQRYGPYKFWHHEHWFYSLNDGVKIIDKIYYQMPFGILGKILHKFRIKSDLEKIFSYRSAKLSEIFGFYNK